MIAVLADTGPLYALVDPDDSLHQQACDELEQLNRAGTGVVVATSTLMEAYSLTLFRLGTTVALRWLREIEAAVGWVDPHHEDVAAAQQRLRRFPDQRITLFDSVLAELGDRLAFPVWTFDHHFGVMGVAVWRSV